MTYIATALARTDTGWAGREVDLAGIDHLDTVTDLLREMADDGFALLFVEEDDEWLGIVRVDADGDARVFLSDGRVIDSSPLAALLSEHTIMLDSVDDEDEDDEEEETGRRPEAEPVGDPWLLADLGIDAEQLLELCAEEGLLPGDVVAAVCEQSGCADQLERLRG